MLVIHEYYRRSELDRRKFSENGWREKQVAFPLSVARCQRTLILSSYLYVGGGSPLALAYEDFCVGHFRIEVPTLGGDYWSEVSQEDFFRSKVSSLGMLA